MTRKCPYSLTVNSSFNLHIEVHSESPAIGNAVKRLLENEAEQTEAAMSEIISKGLKKVIGKAVKKYRYPEPK